MEKIYQEIGEWSEIKLDIIKDYASEYSKILSSQKNPSLYHIYIDAFAGPGQHISRKTHEIVSGSPLNALYLIPPFREYHFIDIEKVKVESLEKLSKERDNVFIYHGDCNSILLEKILPLARFKDYRRALCILDPYGLHIKWDVIKEIGAMGSVEIFLNFPIYDMNLNVLWKNPNKTDPEQVERMNSFWGDQSWVDSVYEPTRTLFGDEIQKRIDYLVAITRAFQERLIKHAAFKYVPEPIPMLNSKNGVLYYLFFASHKPVAAKILTHIFTKYKKKVRL